MANLHKLWEMHSITMGKVWENCKNTMQKYHGKLIRGLPSFNKQSSSLKAVPKGWLSIPNGEVWNSSTAMSYGYP